MGNTGDLWLDSALIPRLSFSPSPSTMLPTKFASSLTIFLSLGALAVNPFTQYAVDFPDPDRVAAGDFPINLAGAEDTIVAWANEMASYGPWSGP